MRERVFTDAGTPWVFSQWWLKSNYYVINPTDVTGLKSRLYAAMRDEVVPNFKKRQKAGGVFINPLVSQHFSLQHQPCVFTGIGQYLCESTAPVEKHQLVTFRSVPGLPMTWLEIEEYLDQFQDKREIAISAAWADVDLSEMQALASLGEAPETVKWIGSLLQRMIHLLRTFSKKQIKKQLVKLAHRARRSPKKAINQAIDSFSDIWLELRYAVRPLVFEMVQAVNAFNACIDKASRFTARGFDRDEQKWETVSDVMRNAYRWETIKESGVRTSNYRAGVLYQLKNALNERLYLWGLDQGIETVWELTPFSFILDWFFNVGDVIGSWSVSAGISPLGSWCTEVHEVTKRYEHEFVVSVIDKYDTWAYSLQKPVFSSLGKATVSWTIKRRIPNPSRYNLPHCSVHLDWAKFTDLATIGRGLLNGLVFNKRQTFA